MSDLPEFLLAQIAEDVAARPPLRLDASHACWSDATTLYGAALDAFRLAGL